MLFIPVGTEEVGQSFTIDGRTYRPFLIYGEGQLYVVPDLRIMKSPIALDSSHTIVASAGTRVQLQNLPCKGVSIKALTTNTGIVYLGNSGVAAVNGRELEIGEVLDITIDNLNRLWLDSAENGDGISYLVIR